ncbi:hypothetical protein ASF82_04080 [Frigoribacterium sp. Leaf164]|uniref:hypothetical protein n=1 Tax=Frigoribacterium sp. Leaf164 TaxID=1736282 RepID=UPI0006F5E832|nr:hypothetical protein [Frigoribacterium sp. Leaf164]KQR46630.1 hypothetical protein ASF82_04080 [Frigoribacterium sp. Leaf164]
MTRSGGATTRTWWFVVLAVLVVADVALIAAAVASTRPGEQREAGPIPTFSSGPTTEAPTPTPEPTTAPSSTQPAGFLSAVSATEAWRASAGSCTDDPALVERSTDGGATWQPMELAFDLRTVVALEAGPEKVSVLGGVGDDCERQFWSSFTAGEFWQEYPDQASTLAFADVDSSTVSLGGAPVPSPCPSPVRASTDGSTSLVACAGAFSTRTGTADWAAVAVPGLLDVTTVADEYVVAVSGVDSCDGVAVQSVAVPVTARSTPTTIGCVAGVDPGAGVVLASVDDAVWLSTPAVARISVDGGVTW